MASVNEQFPTLLTALLNEAFFAGYMEEAESAVYKKLFKVQTSTRERETDLALAGLEAWDQIDDTIPVPNDAPEEVGDVTYIHETYRKEVQIAQSLWEDDQTGRIRELASTLGFGAARRIETVAAGVFNSAFSGGQVGFDGAQLCADSHTLAKSSSTVDNKGTGVLNDANLQAAITAMEGQLDETGGKMIVMPKLLVVPPALRWTAYRLLESELRTGTANNDKNVLKGLMEPVVWPYLTSTTAWFLLDPQVARLKFFWKLSPYTNTIRQDSPTAVYKLIGRMRFSVGFSDWRGVWGSDGSV